MGKTSNGEVITVEDLKKDLEELELDELKEARMSQIDNLLDTYSSTMSQQNKEMLEKQREAISAGKITKQALTGIENTLKSIEANLKMEAEVKEKKGALNGRLSYLYSTPTKTDFQARLNKVDVNNVTIHNGQDLLASLKEIEEKIKEADTEQAKLDGRLANIGGIISQQVAANKDVDALKFKLERIKQTLNGENVDLEQVSNDITTLETLAKEVKEGKDVSLVEFAEDARSWDGTIENLYNCLTDADFDTDRIENLDEWQESCKKALKTMTVDNDTLKIHQWMGTSCGSNVKDYKHKAMLKTLALFAMELDKKIDKGTAKTFANEVTTVENGKINVNASETQVKISETKGNNITLKEFVEGKK